MAKPSDYLVNMPETVEEKSLEINRLNQLVLIIFAYAPDRQDVREYGIYPEKDESFLKMASEIIPAINRNFFGELYIDRRLEREKIEGYIPAGRLILLYGLMGVGKTVLVMKIRDELEKTNIIKCRYFDYKSIGDFIYKFRNKGFIDSLHEVIYHALKKEFIDDSEEQIKSWIKYKIIEDTIYSEVKEVILDLWRKPLMGDEWLDLLNDSLVKSKYSEINDITNLETLLRFINKEHQPVLIFDNVDRFSLEEQSVILDDCIHLSNTTKIPILLTIRTSNLRRILAEGAKGDFVFIDELKKVVANNFEIKRLKEANGKQVGEEKLRCSIKNLIDVRLNFVRRNEAYISLGKYFNLLNEKYGWNYSPRTYITKFSQIFDAVNTTFVREDIYKYCNYNIREILISYFSFINKLLIDPDGTFTFESLFPNDQHARITNLRNFLYKWLLCKGELIPSPHSNLPNVFEMDKTNIPFLTIKILTYLSKFQSGSEGIPFKKLARDFWSFGIDEIEIKRVMSLLADDQDFNDKCLIWVDHKKGDTIENSRLILMPAGQYFLEKLSTSRDYVFWMSLVTELSDEQIKHIFVDKAIDYSLTYNDEFKTRIVYNFIEKILIPRLIDEVNWYVESLSPPEDWNRNKIEYFTYRFAFNNEVYQKRIIKSILSSIDTASMSEDTKKDFIVKYKTLLDEVDKIIERWGVSVSSTSI